VSKVLGVVALVVAGWWTYTNFTVERTHDPTMEVSVEPSVHPLDGSRVLLNVDVFLRNAGKVAIIPRFSGGDDDRDVGLEISIDININEAWDVHRARAQMQFSGLILFSNSHDGRHSFLINGKSLKETPLELNFTCQIETM
jgi:hypothetical protein